CVIGGKEIYTGKILRQRIPHDHRHVLADCHQATTKEVNAAVKACREAWETWSRTPWEHRAAIFLKAADLLAGPYRDAVNAATMLGQGKTAHQAEIDSACELIDFLRFNASYLQQIYEDQPTSSPGVWNQVEYRPLEGFVFAITPFNFTAIGGNLPTAPALMGNVVIWKPARTATASSYLVYKILEEAGLPPGVINFMPGPGSVLGPALLDHPELAGVHFTGSTAVFHGIWETIGQNIRNYKNYPRIVGETGGKDFVFVHPSADASEVATALVRGAFEYQGQKCSAASRAYVPRSLWTSIKRELKAQLKEVKVGDPRDFSNFMGAVIDESSFEKITGAIKSARRSKSATFVWGGEFDKSKGYFIDPTVIEFKDPKHRIMREELFGPVLAVYVYADSKLDEALDLCDEGSEYGLTGAVFARDRSAVLAIANKLRHTAGNFYINDKPTGAVVGQQPFGGSRASGTNDKAGSALNLLRWVTPRTIKETFVPPRHFSYPFLAKDED
ncbi:MAG: L-glutamate gamma-semialdehyde dehydrogenase, partial [Pseudomonadales bacterium]|nr:L-glutamate gamma-semialdehyde dehydrogenase [Pseudomonadales bacterium]